jgi:hypothetical protein
LKLKPSPFWIFSKAYAEACTSRLGEGTWAAWLYDLIKPHVTELVVRNPRRNALLKELARSYLPISKDLGRMHQVAC